MGFSTADDETELQAKQIERDGLTLNERRPAKLNA